MNFADGSRYEGEFQNDKINGQGKLFRVDNSVIIGTFKDGNPVGPSIISEGKEKENK